MTTRQLFAARLSFMHHTVVHAALVSLRIRRITDVVVLQDPSVAPCSAELFIQSRAELLRQKDKLQSHWGHSQSITSLKKFAEQVCVPKVHLDAALAPRLAVPAGGQAQSRPQQRSAVSGITCTKFNTSSVACLKSHGYMNMSQRRTTGDARVCVSSIY